ncbi:MAG: arginase [Firmicutes bacterium]|nr:arginase [Bacillota bacterium]
MAKTIAILGAPSQAGQEQDGTRFGPQALRDAGLTAQLAELGYQDQDWGDLKINHEILTKKTNSRESLKNLAAVIKVSQELFTDLNRILSQDCFPIVLGGDHSISIGSIAAAANHAENLGVIWLDAHPDLNTVETTPSGRIHGMPLAISLGLGHPQLINIGGFYPKIKPDQIVIIGARSIDSGEKQLIKELGIKLYPMTAVRRLGIQQVIAESIQYLAEKTDAVHLSFDLDVLDPGVAPGVGTPSPNGMTIRECAVIMAELGQTGMITSMDIVELNPLLDVNQQTADSAAALTTLLLGSSFSLDQIAQLA